jgi:ABC-type proline/glycine betaine transport system substrate-binding protein
MKSRRNVVAALAVLALLYASPSNAGWDDPYGDSVPTEMGLEDMTLVAGVGLQVLQAAF